MNAPDPIFAAARGLREWATRLPPYWANQTLAAWNAPAFETGIKPFATRHPWSDRQAVNLFQVVGTAHADYRGLTWLDFLQQGKRMGKNLAELESNPEYYLSPAVKQPSMHYISLNGRDWYVNDDGNHRTCIARFLFERQGGGAEHTHILLAGVSVNDYEIDWPLKAVHDELAGLIRDQRLPVNVDVGSRPVGRDDAAGWMCDRFEPHIRLRRAGSSLDLSRVDAEALLTRWRRRLRLGWFARVGGEW